jgi:hypothetical protein
MKLFTYLNIFVVIFLISEGAMAYEELNYEIIYQSESYEIRFYDERLVIQTKYTNENSGFMKLFNYISGSNNNSTKIDMTTPVTQSNNGNETVMQFYLPSQLDKSNIPIPKDDNVEILNLEPGYFAVIRYSGRSSDKNFYKHSDILKKQLIKDNISPIGSPIKATFNGPFTLPFLRRNEAMYIVNWEE